MNSDSEIAQCLENNCILAIPHEQDGINCVLGEENVLYYDIKFNGKKSQYHEHLFILLLDSKKTIDSYTILLNTRNGSGK